jgi:hypothetical protein
VSKTIRSKGSRGPRSIPYRPPLRQSLSPASFDSTVTRRASTIRPAWLPSRGRRMRSRPRGEETLAPAVCPQSRSSIARFSRGRRRSGLFADVRPAALTCRDCSPASALIRSERTYKQEVGGSSPPAPTHESAGREGRAVLCEHTGPRTMARLWRALDWGARRRTRTSDRRFGLPLLDQRRSWRAHRARGPVARSRDRGGAGPSARRCLRPPRQSRRSDAVRGMSHPEDAQFARPAPRRGFETATLAAGRLAEPSSRVTQTTVPAAIAATCTTPRDNDRGRCGRCPTSLAHVA